MPSAKSYAWRRQSTSPISSYASSSVWTRKLQAGTVTHASATSAHTIVLDPFAARNFVKPGETPQGKAFIEFDEAEFEARVNAWYTERSAAGETDLLKPGYADFCKHLFIPNFVSGLVDNALEVTEENEGLLRSQYVARTEQELPVLTRWFPKAAVKDRLKEAKFLDIILYSREQIRKENAAMGTSSDSDAPWGIVSIKPQSIDSEIPMEPITAMRNSLGKEYGGSGVPLDREAYKRSVEYWNTHARVQ
eukprot:gnl/TRDRNA2_/TRDRNA2_167822_c0_seq1.p1 gnl/TRDRNA2_/TRDRNA2_167822_c0~~gnl/TRDRNA2_/TRDRNA2_167822_c0_seq1.p1  ORF type:complete len:249 (-),score=39.04 gnl/TRDRNA2_/TRDRNA2_167822_c0_seq1:112-858(-)